MRVRTFRYINYIMFYKVHVIMVFGFAIVSVSMNIYFYMFVS